MDFDEREHLGHILMREVFENNFSSHIHDIISNRDTKILDIGCGSGFWLTEMAADFPKPSYVGIDMLPVFPTSTVPSNITFQQHNLLNGLPFEDNTFDFIHMQSLFCDFTELQWETIVYKELARILKPGGWMEICDPEFEFCNGGPTANRISSAVCTYLRSRNVDPLIVQRHRSLIESIPSFSTSTVYHEKRHFPLGSYANKLGILGGYHISKSCRDILKGPIGKIVKLDVDINDELAREFDSHKTYFYVHRFYVQKKK
ncbi:S-adenosyl-L-methionine-dependent methyltransferase [Rhizophagus clarus]|nr:S-adenosyl-L-methionine-dependent methyltransferase [Rhizophagus clarus]